MKGSHLDDSYQALISCWISGHWESASGVAPNDFIDSIPGGCVGLILVSHSQVCHNNIHTVLRHLPKKLHECTEQQAVSDAAVMEKRGNKKRMPSNDLNSTAGPIKSK